MADNTSQIAGLFMTPEVYQRERDLAAQKQFNEMAQMDPLAQARASLMYGGYQAGNALAGALGAQDPMMQRLSQRRAFLNQVDMTDPKSLVSAIQNSTQDPELNAFLLGKYKDLTNIMKEQSIIEKNAKWEKQQADTGIKRDLVATVEDKLSRNEEVDPVTLNKAKLAFGEITRPRMLQQPDGSVAILPSPIDASVFPNIGKFIGKTGSTGGSPRMADIISTPLSQETAQTQAETAKETVATVQNAINQVDAASKLYNESKMAGGYAQILSGLPNTDARSLANLTANIKAAFSVEEIAKLKAQSKTGATGFGSLAVKELETIQNAVTALDPADKNYPQQLKTIRDSFDRWKKLMETRSARAEAKVAGQVPSTPSIPGLGAGDIAPKQNPLSGANPQLQVSPEAPKATWRYNDKTKQLEKL